MTDGLPIDPDAVPPASVIAGSEQLLRHRLRGHLDILGVIALGGALGATARYAVSLAIRTGANGFPWATFWTNVSGCLALAVLLVCVMELWPPHRYLRPFAAVGFVGAYTTFSTAMVEIDELLAHGHVVTGVEYLAASVGAGLGGVALGLILGRALVARRARRADVDSARSRALSASMRPEQAGSAAVPGRLEAEGENR